MQIIPVTLKALRRTRGLTQDELAKQSGIAKRTIVRLESDDPPKNVQKHTVTSLADCLKVQPDSLSKPPNEISDEEWKERGYTPIKILLSDDVSANFSHAMHHYGIGLMDLVNAAPWMFTLLAEMSLADRQRKLEDYDSAFQGAMDLLPRHLNHGAGAYTDNEWAVDDEKKSIAARDVFGSVLLDSENAHNDPFDPDKTNPFHAFVTELAKGLNTDAIDLDTFESPHFNGMPYWLLFQKWLDDFTGGDQWAKFAVGHLKIKHSDMPEYLEGPEKTEERIEWLVSKIPPEVRTAEEQRRATWNDLL